jgi:L-fuconolactonase
VIIDAHCHIADRWYEPVDTLLFAMDRAGVDRAVMIQVLGSTDNTAMRAAVAAHPDRLRFVAAPDPGAADAAARAIDAGAVGLRLRPALGADRAAALAPWQAAERAGLTISVAGPATAMIDGDLAAIAAACPRLPLVIEHLGGLARADIGDRQAVLAPVCALAALGTIHVKLTGLGQLAPRLPSIDRAPVPLDLAGIDALLDPVIATFGPDRLLWGSDFPPVAAREGYANALGWSRDDLARRMPDAIAAAFGANALRLFWREG